MRKLLASFLIFNFAFCIFGQIAVQVSPDDFTSYAPGSQQITFTPLWNYTANGSNVVHGGMRSFSTGTIITSAGATLPGIPGTLIVSNVLYGGYKVDIYLGNPQLTKPVATFTNIYSVGVFTNANLAFGVSTNSTTGDGYALTKNQSDAKYLFRAGDTATHLTNGSPDLATNSATASDGQVLSKSGPNLQFISISGAGLGDFTGPSSATDGHFVLFNGATGKVGKDGNIGTNAFDLAGDAAQRVPTNNGTAFNPSLLNSVGSNFQVYVDAAPYGYDTNSGTSPWSAFGSLSNAVNVVSNAGGGVIKLMAGQTYNVTNSLTTSNMTFEMAGATIVWYDQTDTAGFAIKGSTKFIGPGGRVYATNNTAALFVPFRIENQVDTNSIVVLRGIKAVGITDVLLNNSSKGVHPAGYTEVNDCDFQANWDTIILTSGQNGTLIKNSRLVNTTNYAAAVIAGTPPANIISHGIQIASASIGPVTVENSLISMTGYATNYCIDNSSTQPITVKNTSLECLTDATNMFVRRINGTNFTLSQVWNSPDCSQVNNVWKEGSPTNAPISGAFLSSPDGTNTAWKTIPGGGDVLAANNLSEYTGSASTARGNIGAAASATTLTIAGTANQITSSAGAQDLSANRTWTLSLPSAVTLPGTLNVTGNQTNQGTFSVTGNSTNFGAAYFLAGLFSYGVPVLTGASNLDATKLSGTVPMANLSTNVVTATNQTWTTGQALVVTGTNSTGQPVVKGTNWPSGGGGTSFDTNGFPGQQLTIQTDGSISFTNWGAPLGYYTNGTVLLLAEGDSLTTGFSATDGKTALTWLTNSFLPSNWLYGTNAGVSGKTMATIDSEMASVLAPWGSSGTTNKVMLLWGGINDITADATAEDTFAHQDSAALKAKASNCIVVAFTLTSSTGLKYDEQEELRKYNNYIVASTNWDYLVMLNTALPPPPNQGFYVGGTHYASYKPVAFLINQALLRGRKNLPVPFQNTLMNPAYSLGSATPFSGAYGLGADCVFAGIAGSTPILHLGTFGSQLFSIYPNPSAKTVTFGYSGTASTWSSEAVNFTMTPTNTAFNQNILIATNNMQAPQATFGQICMVSNRLWFVTSTTTNRISLDP